MSELMKIGQELLAAIETGTVEEIQELTRKHRKLIRQQRDRACALHGHMPRYFASEPKGTFCLSCERRMKRNAAGKLVAEKFEDEKDD